MLGRSASEPRLRSFGGGGLFFVLALWLALVPMASAEEVRVAVASNFLAALRALEQDFEAGTEHELVISSGSTGQLYAQIVNGAPFDILLAADRERPRLLAQQGRGYDPFTYAIGRLALWSADPTRVDEDSLASLGSSDFRWLAIAEPKVAPYGAAAQQVLEHLGFFSALEPRLVKPQNVSLAFAMVATGNAELGLVAASQALAFEGPSSHVLVPADLHDPIRQDAIVLARGAENAGALAFAVFLVSNEAVSVIERFGYAAAVTP